MWLTEKHWKSCRRLGSVCALWLTSGRFEPRERGLAYPGTGCFQGQHLLSELGEMSSHFCLHLSSAVLGAKRTAAFSISSDNSGQVRRDVIRAFANVPGLHRRTMISLEKIPAYHHLQRAPGRRCQDS